jgi:7-cyano-7-deazaguanine synthase
MTNSTIATVLVSGGIDSAACAHLLLKKKLNVDGLFVDFGQRSARQEHRAAVQLSKHLEIPLREVRVTSDTVFGSGELVGRNAFLAFVALLFTGGRSGVIGLGLHAGSPYYDCSQAFLLSLARLVAEHTDGRVTVVAPFASWDKEGRI